MTTNAPATVLWSMYLVVAEKQGVDWKKLRGTIQNDILKEYIAQKTYIFPPKPSMKLIIDTFEFGAEHVPDWNTISISGYHIRVAGSTALQELAFTLYDGIEYVEWAKRQGLDVDDFAPRLSFFFNAHNDLFEDIAKYRAARKIWYKIMTERFQCKNPKSAILRFHTQTAGCSLTAQQPYNNMSGSRFRRWPRCWAARNRCIPTRWTKRWRCRPNTPRESHCARSRSWRTKPESRTRPIHWRALISWSG
jgi:methylmalonyl-CoA mutase N-terminal domain/subunit